MTKAIIIIVFSVFLLISQLVCAQEIQFNSVEQQVALIELYTSQGCSSCPPADEWVSELQNEPKLWAEFVPVIFHVDYWDYLGWKDRFSKQKYSDRHRLHKHQGHTDVVYTPGFFLNGKEWRSRFGRSVPTLGEKDVGKINATLNGNMLKVKFHSVSDINNATLNVAILGFGYQTPIKSGENSNRLLREDFVLLTHLKSTSTDSSWQLELPKQIKPHANKYGIAIWINQDSDLTPLQATGGWLPSHYFQ